MKIKAFIVLLLVGLSILALFFIFGRGETKEIKTSGTLEAREVEVRSKIGGKLERIMVKEGDPVTKEQIIGHIDVQALVARRKAADAKYELAAEEMKRIKDLYAKGIVSRLEYDRAESVLKQAESEKEVVDVELKDAVITSPLAGTITAKLAEEGEIISPGTSLLTISDLSNIILKVYVTEKELGKIKLKDLAEVSLASYPHEVFNGAITYISSRAEFTPKHIQTREEQLTQVFEVKIDLPNPERKLKPGLYAEARIKIQ